jgi:Raf kinase inhibitor-like YbhB/YbcL family protein
MMTGTLRRRIDRLVLCVVAAASGMAVLALDPRPIEIRLSSPVVEPGGSLPVDHTQLGRDLSPPLAWNGLPEGTRELALVFAGPYDVQPRPFVHWVVYNIPATVAGLDAGLAMDGLLERPAELAGVRQGLTGWDSPGYRGPWPTREPGTYVFTIYALGADLDLAPDLDQETLLAAISCHVIGVGELRVVSQARGYSS